MRKLLRITPVLPWTHSGLFLTLSAAANTIPAGLLADFDTANRLLCGFRGVVRLSRYGFRYTVSSFSLPAWSGTFLHGIGESQRILPKRTKSGAFTRSVSHMCSVASPDTMPISESTNTPPAISYGCAGECSIASWPQRGCRVECRPVRKRCCSSLILTLFRRCLPLARLLPRPLTEQPLLVRASER